MSDEQLHDTPEPIAVDFAQSLVEQERRVDELVKAAAKLNTTLKNWKKACTDGNAANLQKHGLEAADLTARLNVTVPGTVSAWQFDVRSYLDSGEWRTDLMAACAAQGLRVLEEDTVIVSPPVLVRAQPAALRLQIGKDNWPSLSPRLTAARLKKLNEKSASAAQLQQFLNAVYDAASKISSQGNTYSRFREIYDLFALAPGWAKENTVASFAQQIYALHKSEVMTTRDGKRYEIEYASGKPKEKDVFMVVADDGRQIRYYGVWFE